MTSTPLTDALRTYQQARAELGRRVRVQPPGPHVGTLWRTIAAADNLAEVLDARLADVHNQVDRQLLADVQAICDE